MGRCRNLACCLFRVKKLADYERLRESSNPATDGTFPIRAGQSFTAASNDTTEKGLQHSL
jgi:hypothetical protein